MESWDFPQVLQLPVKLQDTRSSDLVTMFPVDDE